ncbi:hypothetical protein ACFQO4_16655 [Saliphagus sp. GCM10025334]|uniref:DUF7344 domain-containing protein n=1 Tax=Natronosalvus rutilus TaxID=2953753 RepID=A0A9E7N9X8_9EURY|nr:hypothetical protein [Natronosalvus rutilus]UTF52807.1 hypothetical protein NGM29_13590 [Natronosalvus rutilus]
MVTLDEIFELLEDQRRRYALYCLYEKDGPVAVSEVVEKIETWEDDPPEADGSLDRFEEIALDLKHVHLPKSAEVDFIQYDREQGLIQVQGSPEEFDALLTIAKIVEEPEE